MTPLPGEAAQHDWAVLVVEDELPVRTFAPEEASTALSSKIPIHLK